MATHVRACESEGTACVVVVSGTRFEFFFLIIIFFFARTALHVRTRTYRHSRAKERPVWLLFLARGLKVVFLPSYTPIPYTPIRYTLKPIQAQPSEPLTQKGPLNLKLKWALA